MTKKDYELIAKTFKRSKPLNLEQQVQFERLLDHMITDLHNENWRFDQWKFEAYIGEYDLTPKPKAV